MEERKQYKKYSNGWKHPSYTQKQDYHPKNEATSTSHGPAEANGQTPASTSLDSNKTGSTPTEKIADFRDLHVWRLGKEIVIDIYKTTKVLPPDELYGLTTQMRRAAISIPSNISEGYNRRYTKDYQRFLSIALGSCAELETQVEVCGDLKYFNIENCGFLLEKIDHETRMIQSLISKL